ncbi:MAG: 2-dehydropantoate 2-reductase [Acidimicrobiales bacterium]
MRVVVAGAGAMGSAMGGLLARAGHDVALYDVRADHMDAVSAGGLTIRHGDGSTETAVFSKATADPTELGVCDLVLVMTKTWATTDAVRAVAHAVGPETWVVSAQNGLGNESRMAEVVGADRVMPGTTTVGATYLEPGVVSVSGTVTAQTSLTQFGPPHGATKVSPEAEAVAAVFTDAGMRAEVLRDGDKVLWTKLAMAGTAGALTALSQISVGDMVASPRAMSTWRAMLSEILAVAAAEGVDLDFGEVSDHAMSTYRAVGDHWASMAVDVKERRRTEIDSLCGEVSARGRRHDIPTPVNDAIGNLILAIEASWDNEVTGG